MKKIFFITTIIAAFALNGCIKNDPVLWKGELAEWDATSWNANAARVDYPLLVQAPAVYGRTVITENANCNASVDPYITRTSGTIRFRVNLIGALSSTDKQVGVKTFAIPFTSVTFRKKTPSCANYTLAVTDAIAGTDYTMPNQITIPANSSFGFLDITILNPGVGTGMRAIGLQLDSSASLKPTTNYSRLAIAIDQR